MREKRRGVKSNLVNMEGSWEATRSSVHAPVQEGETFKIGPRGIQDKEEMLGVEVKAKEVLEGRRLSGYEESEMRLGWGRTMRSS